MDRQTRKANLKKLQLPSTSTGKQTRKTRQTAKTTTGTTAITNYFLTPEKCHIDQVDEEETQVPTKDSAVVLELNKPSEELPQTSTSPPKPATRKRVKRTKLDNFLFKDPNDIPDNIKNPKTALDEDDFVVPEKKVKKAPKLTLSSSQAKTSRTKKKQTTIKSAFFRNEQLFAEIAAQHCAADQFDGDDVQLALAISRSEAESKGLKLAKENEMEEEVNLVEGNNSAESVREKLKKYGFRTAEKNDYNTFAAAFLPKNNGRRQKSKWANKFTALTLRSSEIQLKKLQENIEKLLNSQCRTKPLNEQESLLPLYKLQSSLLKQLNMHENNRILQCPENLKQSIDRYFIEELFEINHLPAGHLLKDWTAIQGRDLTPNPKIKANKEYLQKLQTIYKDLEEYFTSRKRLEWTMDNENKEDQEESIIKENEENKKEKPVEKAESSKIPENMELNEMVEDIEAKEVDKANTTCNDKILKLLPSPGCLDVMQVSSCSINTQATINTTQKDESVAQIEFVNKNVEFSDDSNIVELDEMVDLIETMQRNESVIHTKASKTSDNNISKTSATLKSSDTGQVSSVQTLEISDDSNNAELLDEMMDSIEVMQRNEAQNESTEKHLSVTTEDTPKSSSTSTSLQATLVSSNSNQATINTSQKTRSNSPDLFADSDVEMEECVTKEESDKTEVRTVINEVKDKSCNSSLEDVAAAGVITYEVFSSDEVKNTSLLEQNKSAIKVPFIPNSSLPCDEQVIDLTQDDLSFSPPNHSNNNLNQSKPIVEIDIFAESPTDEEEDINFTPTQNEEKDRNLFDINKNSQISKYLEDNREESFKFTLSMETNENEEHFKEKKQKDKSFNLAGGSNKKENTFLEKNSKELLKLSVETEGDFTEKATKEESFKFSLNVEDNEENVKEKRNEEESFKFSLDISEENFELKNLKEKSFKLSRETKEIEKSLLKKNKSQETFKFLLEAEENKGNSIENNSKEETFKLSTEISDNEENLLEKSKEESFKLSLSLKTQEPLREFASIKNADEDDDDIILRQIAMDQTNTSFLNFQGAKQLETCFHKETANAKSKKAKEISLKEKDVIKDNITANDTMFRELCNKYLNEPQNYTKEKTDFNKTKSFTQILPSIKTPEKYEDYTNFTMDFDMSMDNNLALKRKSTSFSAKTPPKYLSKSQSFNKSKIENLSIDLTQTEGGDGDEDLEPADEEEDDCLVLSDDEINYSIWQANKTAKFHTSETSEQEYDVISILDNETEGDEELDTNKEKIIEFPEKDIDIKNASYLNFENKEKSLIKVALTAEECYSDFGVLTSKYSNTKTSPPPLHDDMKFDRSDFGILEEYSQPIDYTPNLCTPTKVLAEASFLSSPTETTAPMKRYSNCHKSSQKFQDLLNNLDTKSPPTNDLNTFEVKTPANDFNDFDEFDRLVYTSPLKPLNSAKKPPQGMEQLLTAEISFKETENSPVPELTTTKQVITYNNKTYTVRYTSSPKPDYTKYTEAELLKALYNLGIKPLKRKQAVKILEYVYNQTHPILLEDEVVEEKQPVDDLLTLEDFERPSTSKEALKAKTSVTKDREISLNLPNESPRDVVENLLEMELNKKLNLQDSFGREMLRYSLDLKAELLDEQYILQTNVTKKTAQPLLPFHIAWYNLVCSNPKLHETILMYEPIDLQEIYLFLKSLGYRYDPKDLKIFFDRRCIIFRYDLTSSAAGNGKTKDTNRHVRKSKKAKITKK